MSREVDEAVAALRRGELAILPTDTVYGLAADGTSEAAATMLYAAKGRESIRPTALVLGSIEVLLAAVPGLPADAVRVVRALLPGPVTSSSRTPSVASRGSIASDPTRSGCAYRP